MRLAHALAAAALVFAMPAAAQDYVLAMTYETSTEGGEYDSSSSSSGRQAIAERVIAARPEGNEFEYALPFDPEEIRGNERWMFPARMRVAADGRMTLLNADELAARNTAWLAEAEWTTEVCSRWGFTWTAFQVRCDPEAAIEAVEGFGMQPGRIAEGQAFALKGALGPVVLARTGEREGRVILTGSGPVDVGFLREEDARAALVVAEISREALTPEEATAASAAITATGTVSVTFEVDAAGLLWRREDASEYTMTGSRFRDGITRARTTVTRLSRAEWERQQAEAEAEADAADPLADPNPEAEAAEAE
ncbi:hypothetical protein [Erythrobacter donghaensis]|nr:hypothetical protein [Erythrobacter donghaensis]